MYAAVIADCIYTPVHNLPVFSVNNDVIIEADFRLQTGIINGYKDILILRRTDKDTRNDHQTVAYDRVHPVFTGAAEVKAQNGIIRASESFSCTKPIEPGVFFIPSCLRRPS